MDKRTTRAFATGLLAAALFFYIYQVLGPASMAVSKQNPSIKDSSKKDNAEYWHTQYQKLLQKTSHSSEAKTDLIRYHLTISKGMTLDTISQRLKTGEIIKNQNRFEQYLTSHHQAEKIQIGEYDLTSKMSLKQITDIITKSN